MLFLSPPYFTYEGVVVGRDYSDPLQFWYYPGNPRVALDDQGRPAMRFLVYKDLDLVNDENATVGFLFFDTVLSLPDEDQTLKKIAGRLRQDLNLDGDPRLAPLQYRSGKCTLTFLDRVTPPPDAPAADPPSEDWVTVLESTGMPSLYGENRAIFSVGLTKKATSLLLGSFDGFIPAGVVYELDYVAMQRAFEVKVDVDWHVVYDYVRDYEENRFLFFSDDSEKIVAKLVENKTITITASVEGIGDEAMTGQFEEVRKELTQFVFEKFFAPKVNPQDLLDGNVANTILGFIGGLRDAGLPAHFGCSKRELHDDELRTLNIDFTAFKAVERVIAPQAHLSMFWEELGLTKDQVVTVVDSEDSVFQTTSLRVLASARFGHSDVDRMMVDVAFGELVDGAPPVDAKHHPMVLDAEHPDVSVEDWFDPATGRSICYRYTVVFGPDAEVGDGVLLTSDWQQTTEPCITISANALYRERTVEFQRSTLLSGDLFPEVLVHARYADPATGFTLQDSKLLKKDGESWPLTLRLAADAPGDVDYRFDFPRAGADQISTDWDSTTEKTVIVQDPRTNLFPVRVLLGGDRSQLEELLLDLEYTDAAVGIHEQSSFVITPDTANTERTWVFQRADLARTRYRYSQTIIDKDGTITAPGWVESEAPVLAVGKVYAAKWSVVPEVNGPPLGQSGLEKIVVDINYDDDTNDYHAHSQQVFTAPGRGTPLELQLRDPSLHDYRYTVRYVLTTGFERRVGPLGASDTFLVIPSQPPTA